MAYRAVFQKQCIAWCNRHYSQFLTSLSLTLSHLELGNFDCIKAIITKTLSVNVKQMSS